MPDLNIPLQATVRAMDHLFSSHVSAFAHSHWSLPSQPLQGLETLLLGAATPAHSLVIWLRAWTGGNRFGPLLAQPSVAAGQGLLRRTMRQQLRQVLHQYHACYASPATRSRYRITLIWDTTMLLKVGQMMGLVAPFYSAMLGRPAHSIEVVLCLGRRGQAMPADVFRPAQTRSQKAGPSVQNRFATGPNATLGHRQSSAHPPPNPPRTIAWSPMPGLPIHTCCGRPSKDFRFLQKFSNHIVFSSALNLTPSSFF